MNSSDNYLDINRKSWNNVVDTHLASEFYGQEKFMAGETTLKDIELKLLGDVKDKKILHLQCHFGQDSISLARMGAQVTGIDLSDKAIATAQGINQQLGLSAEFIRCDVYDTPNHVSEKFDIVFSSYGTIGWLPDLDKWANVISTLLKPGGKFIFAEFHPVVWMFDYKFSIVEYSYFNTEAIVETTEGTYTDRDAPLVNKSVSWNHPLSEVFSALINAGLSIDQFQELDYSPYNCFQETEEFEPGKFRIKHLGNKVPLVYSLVASK
ncbi:class I SAM-dependent methyltransferase [Sphingobacterium hungaricum]|uniref:SAM-dependent methyltransferase n=1 Tax=Sphingobacterium hungaricum TaxID=2082723 RepID=A0A928V1K7_9SPHI|nr:class I SAM-dependent methyltransferase [Sphingobacterium hungaricum]MBE8715445.1 SAM-dependent methyltransferase [Sphingobacterium hungaricum]